MAQKDNLETPTSAFAQPLVSAVIPTYRRGEVLLRTIEMLRNQTYAPLGIIHAMHDIIDRCITNATIQATLSFSSLRGAVLWQRSNLALDRPGEEIASSPESGSSQ